MKRIIRNRLLTKKESKRFETIRKELLKKRKATTKPWKTYGEVRLNHDQSIDEIVIKNCDFHLEQMDSGSWWIGIYTGPRTGVKPKYGKQRNRKDMMHIRLFNNNNRPVVVNCESDDGLITEGFS